MSDFREQFLNEIIFSYKLTSKQLEGTGLFYFEPGSREGVVIKNGFFFISDHDIYVTKGTRVVCAN